MATLFHGPNADRINGFSAEVLATLQVATFQRFSEGLGFFLTLTDDDQVISSIWCHPTIPIRFVYEDDESVDANDKLAKKLLEVMVSPQGVPLGMDTTPGRPFRYYWPIGTGEDDEATSQTEAEGVS